MKQYTYPFSAIVGQEKMKTALLLNAVDPGIGGVLIGGHKGTGKSSAVRALPRILPQIEVVKDCAFQCSAGDELIMCDACHEKVSQGDTLPLVTRSMPLVELPLSATEDRVVGTLHVEHALKTGKRRFDPGLMASANRGILYVDEVNLLDDHLVDILLDAAASGVNIVEREGISYTHPADFILVGTMNPEEGELRPQLLDRFGLSLTVKSIDDASLRQLVVKRRIDFDRDPQGFAEAWSASEDILSRQISKGRASLDEIAVPEGMVALAVRLSTEAEVQGHRADIVILKTARALAAILEKKQIETDHIIEAARYALPHRMTGALISTPENLREKLEDVLAKVLKNDPVIINRENTDQLDCWYETSTEVPGPTAISNADMIFSFLEKKKLFLKQMN